MYDAVLADIAAAWPALRAGGILAGNWYMTGHVPGAVVDVKAAVDRFAMAVNRPVYTMNRPDEPPPPVLSFWVRATPPRWTLRAGGDAAHGRVRPSYARRSRSDAASCGAASCDAAPRGLRGQVGGRGVAGMLTSLSGLRRWTLAQKALSQRRGARAATPPRAAPPRRGLHVTDLGRHPVDNLGRLTRRRGGARAGARVLRT